MSNESGLKADRSDQIWTENKVAGEKQTCIKIPSADRRRMPGRPTKFDTSMVEQVYKYCLLGATNEELAKLFEVSLSTIDLWIASNEEFSGALKKGRRIADANVAMSLYRRAIGYEHESVKILQYEGRPVVVPYVERLPPDMTACIFWLKNRQRDKWRDVNRQELTGPNGKLLQSTVVPVINLHAPKPE